MELDELVRIMQEELVGSKEAAQILGWDRRRFATYRKREKLPEPIVTLAMGPIWLRRQIVEFKNRG
jgi:hypothetical protein